MMKITRRDLITRSSLAGAAALAGVTVAPRAEAATTRYKDWEKSYSGGPVDVPAKAPLRPGKGYDPVTIPNGASLPFKIVDAVKVFHLTVDEVTHEIAPGIQAHMWGYGGRVNSTVIEAVEGERVRIYVTNRLQVPTTVHWHGIFLPNGMDGVAGVTQPPIPPGETWRYEWTLRQHGTYMYHSHFDAMTQEGMGLSGMFIVHPRNPTPEDRVDRDFVLLMNEYKIEPGTWRPDPNEMTDFNMLTLNGVAYPGTEPLVIEQGQRVRIRLGNLSAMDHHPFHIHGYRFKVTATDGERIPVQAQWPETTVLVAVGQTREIEFVADAPGDWIAHCHMTHHMMNQMGHGLPNMIGMEPGDLDSLVRPLVGHYMTMGQGGMHDMASMRMDMPENSAPMAPVQEQYGKSTMGGLFTVLKVREKLESYADPGWYSHPPETRTQVATAQELERDGIRLA